MTKDGKTEKKGMFSSLDEEERKLCKRLGTSDRFPMILAGTVFVMHKLGRIDEGNISLESGGLKIELKFEKIK